MIYGAGEAAELENGSRENMVGMLPAPQIYF